tara:strand:+ start:108 stop:440 length:333 start_codon:yes stop_codon:yes gene_type:complete
MYIKAKYPKVGNEYGGANAKPQGFGSLYGGNQTSDVSQEDSRALDGSVDSVSSGYTFGGGKTLVYTNDNDGTEFVFSNESVVIDNQSTSDIEEINTESTTLTENESSFPN